jgi:hypothetical protein
MDTPPSYQTAGAFKLLAHSCRFHGRFDLLKGSLLGAPKMEQEVKTTEEH